jgi:hypothetical protein
MTGNNPIILPQRYPTLEACQNAGRAVMTGPQGFACYEARDAKEEEKRP